MFRPNKYSFVTGLLLCALANPVLADNDNWLAKMYVRVNAGIANSDVSVSEIQSDFYRNGLTSTTINDVDDRRIGYSIGLGYEVSPKWALELGYLDLGQVDVGFTTPQPINNLEDLHPESGDGLVGSGLYKYSLDNKTNARVRLGFFKWSANYKTSAGSGSTTGSDSDSGTDIYWGLGFDHSLTKGVSLTGEWQRFEFDRDKTAYLSVGTEWRF